MRIFLARLSHETNGIAPGLLRLVDFRQKFGHDIFQLRGDGSCMGAILDFAGDNNWEVIPSFDLAAGAGPGGADEVVENALECLARDLPPALLKESLHSHRCFKTVSHQTPFLWPPAGTAADDEPMLIIEAADNIGGGAQGGPTWVLQEFLHEGASNVGVILADSAAVEAQRDTRVFSFDNF